MLSCIRKIERYSRKKKQTPTLDWKVGFFRGHFKKMFQITKRESFLIQTCWNTAFSFFLFSWQFCFHGEKMKAFDISLQNNQINLFWREEEKKHCTVPGVGGGAWAHHGRAPLSHIAQHGSCPGAELSWSWEQDQGAETLFHLQIWDLRAVKSLCQRQHNASTRQKKANTHGAPQVKRNVGFAGWGWDLSEISHQIPPKSQERKGRHEPIPASQVLVPRSQAMTTSAFRSTEICYLPSCWMPAVPFQGPRHDI